MSDVQKRVVDQWMRIVWQAGQARIPLESLPSMGVLEFAARVAAATERRERS